MEFEFGMSEEELGMMEALPGYDLILMGGIGSPKENVITLQASEAAHSFIETIGEINYWSHTIQHDVLHKILDDLNVPLEQQEKPVCVMIGMVEKYLYPSPKLRGLSHE